MSGLFFLPAQHGDAFILYCQKGSEEGWIVVDGGPIKNNKKSVFLQEVEKLQRIDLMVLTHHDEDHIAGIMSYVTAYKEEKPVPVTKLWVNCARHIDVAQGGNLSAPQANSLADALKEIQNNNSIEWEDNITIGVDTSNIKFADIDVLSPSDEVLKRYISEYEKKAGAHEQEGGLLLTAQGEIDDLKVSMKDLAQREKGKINENDYAVKVNMASIAFTLRCDGLSVLMLGDCFPQQIVDALTEREITKEKKLKVDFVKVSHHGSKSNISNELLDLIDCRNYLISTDGGRGKAFHPNRESLANIICHPERKYNETLHLHFNYTLQSISDKNGFYLFNEGEDNEYNFVIHEPNKEETETRYRTTCY